MGKNPRSGSDRQSAICRHFLNPVKGPVAPPSLQNQMTIGEAPYVEFPAVLVFLVVGTLLVLPFQSSSAVRC